MAHRAALVAFLFLAGCASGGGGADTTADTVPDTEEDGSDTAGDMPPDTDIDSSDDTYEEADGDAVEEDVEEEEGPGVCGDSFRNTGEVCDDGNTETELCDTTDPLACLSDCSLLMADCGNSTLDPGEQCDDGDDDSMDECTTSCTDNDHSIGAPCRCEGTDCDNLDMTAGTIVGCDIVAPLADSTRTLACGHSVALLPGANIYMAEGFCTLIALGCTGDPSICDLVPVTGDVDAINCPVGFALYTLSRSLGTAVATLKACLNVCVSDADCRWNAVEESSSPWVGDCGQYQCLPRSDTGELTCVDVRNGA